MTLNTIKKILHYLMIPLITLSLFRPAFAKSRYGADGRENPDLEDQYKQAAGELESWFKKPSVYITETSITDQPDLGYYFDNISFKDADDLIYSGNTGVIVSGSRSWNTNPILQREDIIVNIDGVIIKNRSNFEDIIEAKNIGDTITVEYFRHGEIFSKKIPVLKKESTCDKDCLFINTPHKKSWGLGGAAYKPMFVNADQSGFNDLFGSLGFDNLSEINNLYHGFDLQGLVGNGYFIGGYGVWTGQHQSVNYTIDSSVPVNRNLKYNSGLGGVSLDKRYRLSDKWIASAGIMVGGGGTRFEIDQIENTVDWNQMDFDTSGSYNDYLQLKKNYVLLHPRISLMYRVLPVFWLKVEAGYMLSYSKNGWQQILNNNKHDIAGPGNATSLNGFTISVSPWFGF
ncbi:PDZ domain-containing protein [bacterium]|nr:PDZ domain-containing protein [bacterium]MBU1633107.1 PDZ domain-containing protein [bacterium]MBU1874273.1 PDZ domain-containing protein [bacterium]